jgi:hypothetical protein
MIRLLLVDYGEVISTPLPDDAITDLAALADQPRHLPRPLLAAPARLHIGCSEKDARTAHHAGVAPWPGSLPPLTRFRLTFAPTITLLATERSAHSLCMGTQGGRDLPRRPMICPGPGVA